MSSEIVGVHNGPDDLREACRVCMSDAGVVNIFQVRYVLRMIRYCVHFEISETDGLPANICRLCLRNLKIAYRFQIQYEESHRELLRVFRIQTKDILGVIKDEKNLELDMIKEEVPDISEVKIEFGDTSTTKQAPGDINSILSKISSLRGLNIKPVKRKNTKRNRIPQRFNKTRRKGNPKNISRKNHVGNSAHTSKLVEQKYQITKITNSSSMKTEDSNETEAKLSNCENQEDLDDRWTPAPGSSDCPIPDYYKCQYCPVSFATNEEYDIHCNFHTKEVETCDVCHKIMTGRRNILRHHGVHDKYPCELCGKMLHRYDLSKHVRYKHSDWKKECPVCHVVLTDHDYFRVHLKNHTNRRSYQCDICHKTYTTKIGIQAHILRHNNEKPHKCSYCDKTFVLMKTKQDHECLHTGARPYGCPLCDKTFIQKSNMKSHFVHNHREYNYKEFTKKVIRTKAI